MKKLLLLVTGILSVTILFAKRTISGKGTDDKGIPLANDVPIMRVAEMYFIEAEAKARAGGRMQPQHRLCSRCKGEGPGLYFIN